MLKSLDLVVGSCELNPHVQDRLVDQLVLLQQYVRVLLELLCLGSLLARDVFHLSLDLAPLRFLLFKLASQGITVFAYVLKESESLG